MNDGDKETKSHQQRPNWPPVFSSLYRIATASLVAQDFSFCTKLAANILSAWWMDLTRHKSTVKIVAAARSHLTAQSFIAFEEHQPAN